MLILWGLRSVPLSNSEECEDSVTPFLSPFGMLPSLQTSLLFVGFGHIWFPEGDQSIGNQIKNNRDLSSVWCVSVFHRPVSSLCSLLGKAGVLLAATCAASTRHGGWFLLVFLFWFNFMMYSVSRDCFNTWTILIILLRQSSHKGFAFTPSVRRHNMCFMSYRPQKVQIKLLCIHAYHSQHQTVEDVRPGKSSGWVGGRRVFLPDLNLQM